MFVWVKKYPFLSASLSFPFFYYQVKMKININCYFDSFCAAEFVYIRYSVNIVCFRCKKISTATSKIFAKNIRDLSVQNKR